MTKTNVETNLAQAIETTGGLYAAYDANMKYLLADRQILARILKYSVEECKDMEIEEIMGSIGDDIEIETRPVDAGLSNLGRISGDAVEDNVPGEGVVFYDIRFTAYLKSVEMKILVNMEAQKTSDFKKLGYHLENRIIFYLARMVSAQKQTEFFHSDFDNLKKVRSIWICMDNGETGDSIEELAFERKTVFGNQKSAYQTDLMKAIIINVRNGENIKKSKHMLIAMLEELISDKNAAEKKRILAEEYGMTMTAEIEGRMNLMCNWSEAIRDRAIEEGMKQGIEKGMEQGIEKERLAAVERMIKVNITKEQIISMGYTEAEYAAAGN